jgi:hypothetical protein
LHPICRGTAVRRTQTLAKTAFLRQTGQRAEIDDFRAQMVRDHTQVNGEVTNLTEHAFALESQIA